MKTVGQIYEEYKLQKTLQAHMLRVAAVASMLCDSMEVPVDKENIVLACLFHDMGNIIKFDMEKSVLLDFYQPEGVEYWKEIQKEYFAKYGHDEDEANLVIMRELGLSERAIFLVGKNKFSELCDQLYNSDLDTKITHYCDGRVGPYGVLSYQGRMDEAGLRYKDKNPAFLNEERIKLVNCGLEIEKEIFSKSKIKPEDINDDSIKDLISVLREYVIK